MPADRFFGASSEVAKTLKERVSANALDLARHGQPSAPFYVTGQMEGQAFSVHAEGQRLILTRPGQPRQEVELVSPVTADNLPQDASSLPNPVCPSSPLRPIDDRRTEDSGAKEARGDS
jgi:hypothetical protein